MAEDPEHLVLVYLRRMDAKLDTLAADVGELRQRMSLLEERVAMGFAHVERSLALHATRLGRIERRLDLAEEPAD